MSDSKYDGILYNIVQSTGGYDGFFDEIFGFLSRKTDFFSDSKKAEEILAKTGIKYIGIEKKKKENQEKKLKEAKLKEEIKKSEKPNKIPANKTNLNPETIKTDDNKNKDSDKLIPNKGNGSQTEKYSWTQKLDEVQISIPIEKGVKSKDLKVEIEMTKVYIGSKNGNCEYINGEWFDKIHSDDSLWTLEEANGIRTIEITIPKWKNSTNWWNCLIKGEKEIDTQKINPETSKLSDLDGEMKSTVEKMMFDMNQKQKGLPTSDEQAKQDKLKEFMKAHPEMDFSKAKFS